MNHSLQRRATTLHPRPVRLRSRVAGNQAATRPGAVNRIFTIRPGAWPAPPGRPDWATYPPVLGAIFAAPPAVFRPRMAAVRGYLPRRELVVYEQPAPPPGGRGLIVAWYHAISGGHASTIYDLYDVLTWLLQRANQLGGSQCVALVGDLNLVPDHLAHYLGPLLPPGLAPAPTSAANIAANTSAILASGLPTQSVHGRELDYAVVMNIDPGGGGGAFNAFLECGTIGGGGALVPAPAGVGPFPSLNFPGAPANITDHRPVRLQLDY